MIGRRSFIRNLIGGLGVVLLAPVLKLQEPRVLWRAQGAGNVTIGFTIGNAIGIAVGQIIADAMHQLPDHMDNYITQRVFLEDYDDE